MEPDFSVIIPSFNRSGTLVRAIKSILNQTFSSFEIIVVDDGSTDKTAELVNDFPMVNYIYQENSGVTSARNKGAEKAIGIWLIFLDSDDELLPGALEEFAFAIGNSPDSKVFLSGFKIKKTGTQKFEDYPARSQKYSPQLTGTFVVKSSLFFSVGKYDEDLGYAENMELFFRLAQNGEIPVILESMTLLYHESASGGSKSLKKMDESLSRILIRHCSRMEKLDLWNLHQTLGVIQLRRGKFEEARITLIKAIRNQPFKFSTYLRFLIGCFPIVSGKIYKSNFYSS